MSFDNLGDRMKDYENIYRIKFTKKCPVVIRLDGKAFHSFTKGFKRPFDNLLMEAMQETCKYLCQNIMGCKLAYTQSDEISLLLVDYENIESQPWFESNIQKMVSVSASMATLAFNQAFSELVATETAAFEKAESPTEQDSKYIKQINSRVNTALFDSRAFILPKEEVCNYFIWRQKDASRNSVLMVSQAMMSPKEMHGIKCDKLQEIMIERFGIDWNDYPPAQKRGCCIVKETYDKNGVQRSRWSVDHNTPVFTQSRDYIDDYVFVKAMV